MEAPASGLSAVQWGSREHVPIDTIHQPQPLSERNDPSRFEKRLHY
jgi:hypothetical protein